MMRPSNSHIWTKCAGWFRYSESVETLPSGGASADEGNVAHEVAANLLRGIETPDATEEMRDGAALWVETIRDMVGGDIQLENIERKLTVLDGMEGTPDYFHWNPEAKRLHIFDYKFGFVPVEVEANPQLICYASGVIEIFNIYSSSIVTFIIVQPRDFTRSVKFRTWSPSPPVLKQHAEATGDAHETASYPDQPLTVGTHCTYCNVRDQCPALAKGVGAAMDFTTSQVPVVRSPSAIGREWGIIKEFQALLTSRATGLEAQLTQMIKNGVHDTGYVMGSKGGKLAWTVPTPQILAFGELMKIDVAKHDAKTPTQVMALLKKAGLPPESIASMSARGSGKRELIPADKQHKEVFGNG